MACKALYLLLLCPSLASSSAIVLLIHSVLAHFRSSPRSPCAAFFSPIRAEVKYHFFRKFCLSPSSLYPHSKEYSCSKNICYLADGLTFIVKRLDEYSAWTGEYRGATFQGTGWHLLLKPGELLWDFKFSHRVSFLCSQARLVYWHS